MTQPVDVGMQKQLFIDDYVIGHMSDVSQQLNQPVKHADNPLIAPPAPRPPDTEELIHLGGSVIYDEAEGLFKMWYEANNATRSHAAMAYATSTDGIHWDKPCHDSVSFPQWHEPACRDRNNFVLGRTTARDYTELCVCVFKDEHESARARRYKMIYREDDEGAGSGSVWSAFSADGISWSPQQSIIADADSFHSVLWDPALGKYLVHSRFNRNSHPSLPPQRQVLQSESEDFDNWSTYGVVMKPDADDPSDDEFYNMEWMPYEGVFVGFVTVFHTVADRLDVQLAFSRDNRNWLRSGNRAVFIPNSTIPGDYDYGMVWNVLQHPIVVGDEIWIYYNGASGLHNTYWEKGPPPAVQGGVIAMAKLRLDGFVSVDASSPGTLTTKQLTMAGDRLIVNADATGGSLKVEILDAAGEAIGGLGLKDCEVIKSDHVRHAVRWGGRDEVSNLKGRTISLRFHLSDCKLYSFEFAPKSRRQSP